MISKNKFIYLQTYGEKYSFIIMIKKTSSLFGNQGFIKYFKNISWRLLEQILRMIVGLFLGVWVARYLGPEQYGLFSYAQSFVGLFIIISRFGLDAVLVRELVKGTQNTDELMGTAFYLRFFGFIVVLLLLLLSIQFTSNDTATNILVFIIASAIMFQSFNVIDLYFQSKVLSKYIVLVNIVSLFLSSIIKIIFILNEAPLISFALLILFDSVILAIGFIYIYIKKSSLKILNWKFNKSMAMTLFRDSWPLIISGVSIAMYIQIDQVMIKEMLDNVATGQYAAAVRLSNFWYFVPTIVASSLFPAIVNAKKQNEKHYYSRLQKLYTFMAMIAITVAIPVTFLDDWIVNLIYGEQYDQSGSVLSILIWAGLAVALGAVWKRWIINENKQVITLYGNVFGALINIVLNLFFIKAYGINGAAIATLISFWISTLFGYALYKPSMAYSLFLNSFNLSVFFKIKGK